MAVGYKGQRKKQPKELVRTVWICLTGFAGNVGTKRVA